jgi:hypothetical protein
MTSATFRTLLLAATATAAVAAGAASAGSALAAGPHERLADGAVLLATDDDSASAYRQRMGAQIDEWKTRVEDYSRQAKAKGSAASEAAAQKLSRAWDDVKTQWSKLQGATDDTWDDTKAAFENAWRNFQDSWKAATSQT